VRPVEGQGRWCSVTPAGRGRGASAARDGLRAACGMAATGAWSAWMGHGRAVLEGEGFGARTTTEARRGCLSAGMRREPAAVVQAVWERAIQRLAVCGAVSCLVCGLAWRQTRRDTETRGVGGEGEAAACYGAASGGKAAGSTICLRTTTYWLGWGRCC
jgi:hypothetical protein